MRPLSRPTRAAGIPFVLVSAVHLGSQLAGASRTAEITQWFLMPLLAIGVVVAAGSQVRDRVVRLTLVALAFSWLGDTAPDLAPSGGRFLVLVGLFLVAQVVYIVAFLPYRHRSVLCRPGVVPYGLAVLALVTACAPRTGALLLPTVLYAGCLASMAILATGVHRWVGVGAAVFLVSDSLIALHAFTSWYALPRHGFWVMLTYVVGQALIAACVGRRARSGDAALLASAGDAAR